MQYNKNGPKAVTYSLHGECTITGFYQVNPVINDTADSGIKGKAPSTLIYNKKIPPVYTSGT